MGAKLVKVVEEKGTKTLSSGSVLHKYLADLSVDGVAVNGAKVAVWGDTENTAFLAGTEMAARIKTDDYGTEYNLSAVAKAGGFVGKGGGGGFAARPPRYEDSEAGFRDRQKGIMWCNALTSAVASLGLMNSEELTIPLARAFLNAGLKELAK